VLPPDSLAAARLNLADRVADEIRASLDAGEPAHVLERIEELARHKISGPALRRLSRDRRGLARGRGRGPAGASSAMLTSILIVPSGLAGGAGCDRRSERGWPSPESTWNQSRKAAAPQDRGPCTRPLAEKQGGPQTLAAAEAVLAVIPEHPAARQGPAAKAWQQIAAIGPSGTAQWPQRGRTHGPGPPP